MRKCAEDISAVAFDHGAIRGHSGACHVDNLYFWSHSLGGAIRAAEVFERVLASDWRQAAKPGSKKAFVLAGSPEAADIETMRSVHDSWSLSSKFECLGHWLEGNATWTHDFEHVRAIVWNALLRNFSSTVRYRSNSRHKHILFHRVLTSIIRCKCPKWPSSESLAKKLDALQRKCIAFISNLERRPGEDRHLAAQEEPSSGGHQP